MGLAGCDKLLPRMMMAMPRLTDPSVFMYGGSILPGRFKGHDVTVVDVFEAVGMRSAGNMTDGDPHELECAGCPAAAVSSRQHDGDGQRGDRPRVASLGALPRSAGSPEPHEECDHFVVESSHAMMSRTWAKRWL